MSESRLFYVYDPMCSWCYAFSDSWRRLQKTLPESIRIVYVLGGLAPDTDEPMPEFMRNMIQQTWQKIEKVVPGIHFNYDFWTNNTPIRSTYPACRAVLAANKQNAAAAIQMSQAIQSAYYQNARNPSLPETLAQCAQDIGLDVKMFATDLVSEAINADLQQELKMARALRVFSFPSLRFIHEDKLYPLNIEYIDNEKMLHEISSIMA